MTCQHFEEHLLDYLEGDLSPEEASTFRAHLDSCSTCQNTLILQQQIFNQLDHERNLVEVPYDFMVQVEEKLTQQPQKRSWKPLGLRLGIIAVVLSLLLITTDLTTGLLSNIAGWWQFGSGTKLAQKVNILDIPEYAVNISAEDQNIKITIVGVAADEFGTELYYTVEDLNKEVKYDLSFGNDGVWFANVDSVWTGFTEGQRSLPLMGLLGLDPEEPNYLHKGKITLLPISNESDILQLHITKLDKLSQEVEQLYNPRQFLVTEREVITGDWQLEIPVKKTPSHEYKINRVVDIDGVEVTIDTITVAPTTTMVVYKYSEHNLNIEISLEKLVADGLDYEMNYSTSRRKGIMSNGRHTKEEHFETLYGNSVEQLDIYFDTIERREPIIKEQFAINMSEPFPQTYEFMGTKISIDQVEVGVTTIVDISILDDPLREFDGISFSFTTSQDGIGVRKSWGGSSDYYFLDREGNRYNTLEEFVATGLPKGFRRIDLRYQIELRTDDQKQEVIPTHITIDRYEQTKFLNDKVSVKLK